jgi:hypothetical protein
MALSLHQPIKNASSTRLSSLAWRTSSSIFCRSSGVPPPLSPTITTPLLQLLHHFAYLLGHHFLPVSSHPKFVPFLS